MRFAKSQKKYQGKKSLKILYFLGNALEILTP